MGKLMLIAIIGSMLGGCATAHYAHHRAYHPHWRVGHYVPTPSPEPDTSVSAPDDPSVEQVPFKVAKPGSNTGNYPFTWSKQ